MREDQLRILKMLEEGKINAEEAAQLLGAIGVEGAVNDESAGHDTPMGLRSLKGKKLCIRVEDLHTGKKKANIRIPLKLARMADRMIPKDAKREMEEQGIVLSEILNGLEDLEGNTLVDVIDDESNQHVSITIE